MKRIRCIFLNVVLSLQLIFASTTIPEDSFIRAGSCTLVEKEDRTKHYFFEVTQTKPMDSMLSTESKDSGIAEQQPKRLKKGEESNLEVKNIELPYIRVADPAYDQTFKRIFSWDNPIDGIKGEDRLMSLLNSILFPDVDENGFKIRTVESLSNEVTKLDEKTALGVLKFDIACRCSCFKIGKAHKVEIFDVEMQTGYQAEFQDRLFDYGNRLRLENNHSPTIVLAFLNYSKYLSKKDQDESAWVGLYYKDLNTGCPIEPLHNVVDTHSVDLSQKSIMLKTGTPIFIGGKLINNKVGKEWLKLLSIRHWATKNGTRYIIPDTAKDPVVKSAIKMLSCVDEKELARFIEDEDFSNGVINTAKKEGLAEGEIKGKIETARNMLQMNLLEPDKIAQATGLPTEQINALKEELEKSKEEGELEEEDDE